MWCLLCVKAKVKAAALENLFRKKDLDFSFPYRQCFCISVVWNGVVISSEEGFWVLIHA